MTVNSISLRVTSASASSPTRQGRSATSRSVVTGTPQSRAQNAMRNASATIKHALMSLAHMKVSTVHPDGVTNATSAAQALLHQMTRSSTSDIEIVLAADEYAKRGGKSGNELESQLKSMTDVQLKRLNNTFVANPIFADKAGLTEAFADTRLDTASLHKLHDEMTAEMKERGLTPRTAKSGAELPRLLAVVVATAKDNPGLLDPQNRRGFRSALTHAIDTTRQAVLNANYELCGF
jgi:hypothetical protein